jgi:DNA-binding SARP family transcriptional activator
VPVPACDRVTAGERLQFGILGPLLVTLDGDPVPVATRRQRALLVLLVMNAGKVVPTERLVDQLWDGAPPPQAGVTLRSYVSNLRQSLGGREGFGGVLATRGQGYALDVPGETVDAVRLRTLTEAGHEHLRGDRADEALAAFTAAVGLWRGDPLADVADHEAARSTVTALTELYLSANEGRFEALLATGRHTDALPGLESFVADHPLREGPRRLQMLGLYRSGRVAEALEVHRRFRQLLADELGIDPSPRLDTLHQRILEQAPELDAPPRSDVRPEASPTVGVEPAPAPAAAGPRTGPPAARPVVGRTRELRLLAAHLDRLRSQRRGGLVLVAGEPGIGKTTILEAFDAEARAHGVGVHLGRSPAASGAPPFWPWTQLLGSVAARLDDDRLRAACAGPARPVVQLSTALADRVGQPPALVGDNVQTMRFLLYEAVSAYLRAASPDPTVLLLDDLHWADPPSLELLSYLAATLSGRPLLVVAAFRDLPAARTRALDATLATVSREDVVEEVRLSGLPPEAVGELVHELVSTTDDPRATNAAFVSLLHERTGGNPFFVRQLGRLLLETTDERGDPCAAPVPPGVRHVIGSRLRELSAPTTTLLEAAAVLGREFTVTVAAAAAGLAVDEALDGCDEAERHGLVETSPGGGYRFVHALVQETVVAALPAGRVARLHAAVAAQLQRAGAPVDELAEHLWVARDLVGVSGLPAQLEAAESAMTVFAYERAEQYLRRALQLVRLSTPPDPHTELTVLLRLFRLVATDRGWGDADVQELVARARELAAGCEVRGDSVRLRWSLWMFLIDRDDLDSASDVAAALEAVAAADVDDAASLAAFHVMAMFTELAHGRGSPARDHLRTARTFADAADNAELAAFDEHLNVFLFLVEGTVAALDGDATGHRASVEAAIALADANGRPFPRALARTLATTTATYLPNASYVQQLADEALELSRRFGFTWLETAARSASAYAGAQLGDDPSSGIPVLQEVLDYLSGSGRVGNASTLLLMLAELQHRAGRLEESRASLVAARANPGPYQGLLAELVDRRLAALPA